MLRVCLSCRKSARLELIPNSGWMNISSIDPVSAKFETNFLPFRHFRQSRCFKTVMIALLSEIPAHTNNHRFQHSLSNVFQMHSKSALQQVQTLIYINTNEQHQQTWFHYIRTLSLCTHSLSISLSTHSLSLHTLSLSIHTVLFYTQQQTFEKKWEFNRAKQWTTKTNSANK
jgi:hypothetical protein